MIRLELHILSLLVKKEIFRSLIHKIVNDLCILVTMENGRGHEE